MWYNHSCAFEREVIVINCTLIGQILFSAYSKGLIVDINIIRIELCDFKWTSNSVCILSVVLLQHLVENLYNVLFVD